MMLAAPPTPGHRKMVAAAGDSPGPPPPRPGAPRPGPWPMPGAPPIGTGTGGGGTGSAGAGAASHTAAGISAVAIPVFMHQPSILSWSMSMPVICSARFWLLVNQTPAAASPAMAVLIQSSVRSDQKFNPTKVLSRISSAPPAATAAFQYSANFACHGFGAEVAGVVMAACRH